MKYKEQLDIFSESVFGFDQEPSPGLNEFVEDEGFAGIRVYRKNLFFLAYERIKEDYPASYFHLEEDNFGFFVRKYLLEKKVNSHNISDFSNGFSSFLDETKNFHQDEILYPLAQLDRLYLSAKIPSLTVPKGCFLYWSQLIQEKDEIEIDIDLGKTEVIFCRENDGERYLTTVPPIPLP